MKLHVAGRAPNPERVLMFMAEKGIQDIEVLQVDLMRAEQRRPAFLALNPLAQVPVLQLDDGRCLSESRAICSYLEGLYPEPNLMGRGWEEHAFIEMADQRAASSLGLSAMQAVRHSHPALAALEQPQLPAFAQVQAARLRSHAQLYDTLLSQQAWVAGERFTVADITLFCMLEFARGLLKYRPGEEGLSHLQAWRDRVAARASTAR